MGHSGGSPERAIDVFLADDNLIVREGVRALIERHADLRVVGVAADYDEVVTGATATEPQVLVTDVRMPPSFQREGIDAAKEVRKRFPGTGVEAVFVRVAGGGAPGTPAALNRLRLLHRAIVDREEQGETLSRLLPGGLAEKLRGERLSGRTQRIGETERVVVTVLMSDIRSYSTIAEHADPSQLAGQLNTHRAAMNRAILGEGGTVMQFVGDAAMAVFAAPFPPPYP